ncbi:MAG: alpha/beta fold hydrolase [Gammaproteobacteria bacterium]|nr:alpha/beta fold hydrolase [Gammaproteobacteria bacterium]
MLSGRVDVGKGVELYYEEYGKGKPILFIPGLTCTTEFFEKNLEVLATDNHVICYDPRSQGRSSITESGNNFLQRGHDLAAFIQALQLEDIVIAGWSLGSYDAWSYFQLYGLNKVRAYVNIDMAPKTIQMNEGDWSEGPLEVVHGMYASILAENQAHFFDSYAHYMIIRDVSEDELNWIVEQSRKTPLAIAAQIVADATFCDFSDTIIELTKQKPVMHFIKQDWSEAAENWLDKNTPGAPREIMGGHMMFWEEADSFNDKFHTFVKSLN